MSTHVLQFPSPAVAPMVERGVWLAPYLSVDGRELLVAIDSRGRELAWVEIRDDVGERRASDALEALLNVVDPIT